jgi:peptidoglycan/LPS O-acetylase OafA/YrhL
MQKNMKFELKYIPEIQGLRALAVLMVIIFHAEIPLQGGFLGVDVFFVISGFVIGCTLINELESTNSIDFIRFYSQRFRRLLPALAVMLVTVATFGILFNPIGSQISTAMTGIAASLFTANGFLYVSSPGYFSPSSDLNPLLHTWSLAVEEQFYFIFPIFIYSAWRLSKKSRFEILNEHGLFIFILVFSVVSFILSLGMSYGFNLSTGISAPTQFAFYASPTRAWEFAAGTLLALMLTRSAQPNKKFIEFLGVTGLITLLYSSVMIDRNMVFPGWIVLLPVIATLFIICAACAPNNIISTLLSKKIAVWIGERSYSWYLWHWPFVVFTRAFMPESTLAIVFASALSLIPAAATYKYIENPIRKKIFSIHKTIKLIALCIFSPILMFTFLILANKIILKLPTSQNISDALELHIDTINNCKGFNHIQFKEKSDCIWMTKENKGNILLIGDSNAGQLTEPAIKAANDLGYNLIVATMPACPFVDLKIYNHNEENTQCMKFIKESLLIMQEVKPSLVIIASASDGYIEQASTTLRLNSSLPIAKTPIEKSIIWTTGLDKVINKITDYSPILIVHPVPRFHHWSLQSCPAYDVIFNNADCGSSVDKSDAIKWRNRAWASENTVINQNINTFGIDFFNILCDADTCFTNKEDKWIFRDGAHLSVPGSIFLTENLKSKIFNILNSTR